MNSFLLHSPIFVARYTMGPGYERIDHLFSQSHQGRLCCSILSLAEVIARLVRLRRRGKYPAGLVTAAVVQLRLDVLQPVHFTKLTPTSSQVEASFTLIDRYQIDASEGLLLRVALDHATSLRAAGHNLVLMSSGKRLLQVARKEGLLTFHPETQSQAELDALINS